MSNSLNTYPSHHYHARTHIHILLLLCRFFFHCCQKSNSHPLVATDCTDAVRRQFFAGNVRGAGKKDPKYGGEVEETPSALEKKKATVIAKCPPLVATLSENNNNEGGVTHERITIRMETVSLGRARLLRSNIVNTQMSSNSTDRSSSHSITPVVASSCTSEEPFMSVPTRRHPTLVLQLPQPLGGPVQLHPRESHAGLACMMDGSLALFYLHPMAYYEALPSSLPVTENDEDEGPSKMMINDNDDHYNTMRKQWAMSALEEIERKRVGNLLFLISPPPESDATQYFITCAAFGKDGNIVWAVTK